MELNQLIKLLNTIILNNIKGFQGAYLYGSAVSGNYGPDSDIDLIVLFDRNLSQEEKLDLAGFIGEVEYKHNVFIDYHPLTMEELKASSRFYNEVAIQGIYYEAA